MGKTRQFIYKGYKVRLRKLAYKDEYRVNVHSGGWRTGSNQHAPNILRLEKDVKKEIDKDGYSWLNS